MTKRQFFRLTAFLLLVALLLYVLCMLFKFQDSQQSKRMRTYKDQQPGAIDAVYIGASGVDRFWITSKAYEDYGMTVYPISTDGMATWVTLPTVKEALRTQTPKLIIVDIRCFGRNEVSKNAQMIRSRTLIDELPFFSPNRFWAIDRTLDHLHEAFPDEVDRFDISLFFTFIRYHNKWSKDEFTFEELKDPPSEFLGTYVALNSALIHPWKQPEATDECLPLEDYNEYYLRELLQFGVDNHLNMLFVNSPHWCMTEESGRYNTIASIIEEYGYPHVFYQSAEMMAKYGFDSQTDYYEGAHVNFDGAVKYTDVFAAYLAEHYDLPDHRDDPKCASWNGVYQHVLDRVQEYKDEVAAMDEMPEVQVGKTD